jgi:uncharacterized protein (TIGR04255 family)
MIQSDQLHINTSGEFPHLSRAAISEAVIEIRARAGIPWNEEELLAKLSPQLTGYPTHQSTRGFIGQFQVSPGREPKVASKDLGWQGLQFTSADKKQVVKFQVDLFSFSRLHPYQRWKQFVADALRLWEIHKEVARPPEIQRLGVRFINRFPLTEKQVRVDEFFKGFPDDLQELNLVLAGFLHHDTLMVPGHPYAMNIIKTVQAPDASGRGTAFVLDIDVFTQQPFEGKSEMLQQKLAEIRWLKNKAFFGIVTQKLMENLQ